LILALNKCKLVSLLIEVTEFYLKQACLENEISFSTYSLDLVILGKGKHLAFVACRFFSSSYKNPDIFCNNLSTWDEEISTEVL